jgi:hypothetical protein
MSQRFEYGLCRIKDIRIATSVDKNGQTSINHVTVQDRPVRATRRFWSSLHHRFGFTHNIFRYFSHEEVFQRISEVAANDEVRWCIGWNKKARSKEQETGTLLAVSNPTAGIIKHSDLMGLLKEHQTESFSCSNGTVRSVHSPRSSGTFAIAGDKFQNKFVLETPVDGFGKPSVYLSLLRLICSNGAIGYAPAFRSELNVGRGGAGTNFALQRVLEGFNNEEGFAALRQRFESASRSWASVHEVNSTYRTLARLLGTGGLAKEEVGGDGASLPVSRSQVLRSFNKMTGDLAQSYGLANLDALSVKRQRTLPAGCKVYDLLNFASELATHHASDDGQRTLQAYIGGLVGNEFDLEGTAEQFTDWRDFFIGNEGTTSTLASLS